MKLIMESWRRYLLEAPDDQETKQEGPIRLTRFFIDPPGFRTSLFSYANRAARIINDRTKTDLPSPYLPDKGLRRTQFWFTERGLEKYREFLNTIVELAEPNGHVVKSDTITVSLDGVTPDYDIGKYERELERYGGWPQQKSIVPGAVPRRILAYRDPWQVAFYGKYMGESKDMRSESEMKLLREYIRMIHESEDPEDPRPRVGQPGQGIPDPDMGPEIHQTRSWSASPTTEGAPWVAYKGVRVSPSNRWAYVVRGFQTQKEAVDWVPWDPRSENPDEWWDLWVYPNAHWRNTELGKQGHRVPMVGRDHEYIVI